HAAALVELARAVRTGPRTQLAADAERGIDENDAVLGAFVGSAGRAHRHAVRLLAMVAVLGKIYGAPVLAVAHFERVHAIEPHAPGLGLIGTELRQGPGFAERGALLAAHHAGVAPDAGSKNYDTQETI